MAEQNALPGPPSGNPPAEPSGTDERPHSHPQPGFIFPPPPPPPPKRERARRVRPKWLIPGAVSGVAALALIASLLVWASWNQSPVAPSAVRVMSPTATSARVTWTASKGGAAIGRYLVLRDGRQVGSVPASRTSYLDHGLRPGTTYRYTVIGESGTQRSAPSARATVRTIAPGPVDMTRTKKTWTTVTFTWSPSPKGPVPSRYVISRDGSVVDVVPGTTDRYTAPGLSAGTTYRYNVAAEWGGIRSVHGGAIQVATLSPPLRGLVQAEMTTVSTPGSGASFKAGDQWGEAWNFSPRCTTDSCTLKASLNFDPPSYRPRPFAMTMTRAGGAYAGSATAQITQCKSVRVQDTITLRITSRQVSNGAWNSWKGTMVIHSPYITVGSSYYCPSQNWRFSVTGNDS